MLAVIRLRGGIKVRKDIEMTLDMLKLKRVNTLCVLEDNVVIKGMLKKIESFVTWGEASDEVAKQFTKPTGLKPAKGGLKSIKQAYPKGDLGYRGKEINTLIKRMQ